MKINNFKILNAGPLKISFPNERNVLIKTQVDWTEDADNVNGTITYSVAGNNSNIRFSDGSSSYVVNHSFDSPICIANDTLTFLLSGTTSNPSKQFNLDATINLCGKEKSDSISIVITQ